MYGTPHSSPPDPESAPSIENGQIVERRCIGFENGCGCVTCLAVDRHHQKIIEQGRARHAS